MTTTDAARDETFSLAALHQQLAPPAPPEAPKLGLHTASFVKPTIKLSDFVLDGAPKPPPAVHRSNLELLARGYFPCWLNNELGDCVEEMVLHTIEALHADAGTTVGRFERSDAEHLYELMAGWEPKNSQATDNGTDENVAMQKWEGGLELSDGQTHKIEGTIAVDATNPEEVKRAVWEFVAPQMAVQLPITAQGQQTWQVVNPNLEGDSAPGSWGGHGVPIFSYDGTYVRLPSWGTELLATWEFEKLYFVECHVVMTQEMMNRSGVSPTGINWDALTAAFRELRG